MARYALFLASSMLALGAVMGSRAIAAGVPSNVSAVIADAGRPDADKQRDENRKPAEMLEFAGVKSGELVGELLPGGGYFTRLFSKAVGPKGHVYALVPERPANAPADMPDLAARVNAIAADANYSNVSVVVARLSKLTTPMPVDLLWTSQNYHDLHNIPGLDIAVFNKVMFDALKPGGLYIVLDHAAAAGSGVRDTATLHRIDPETVKSEVLAAGFVFVAASDALKQPADDHTAKVFDPAIRGKTDQFILKFRKPAAK